MTKVFTQTIKLNKEQREATRFGNGPLLIIAGAGTGKTTVVTERINYLISSGRAKPQEVLALTFTEKASREMEERVDMSLPYGVTQMWISTFHSFCDRLLRSEAINIGLDPGYRLMTEAETILFFRKHLFKFNLSYFRPLGNPTKFIEGMLQHFSRLKDEDTTSMQYFDWVKSQTSKRAPQNSEEKEERKKYTELAHAFRTYEELKVKESVMDYADLISNALKLFRMRPKILSGYQQKFPYVLIDEFQDTNCAQNELAILLAGKRQNITVVGDDDQAIYRWRGAAISNIIQFRSRFPRAKIIVLTKNYRSTKQILDRSYKLIQNNNPDRLEAAEKINKKLICMRKTNGTHVSLFNTDRVENEAESVANEIRKIHGMSYNWNDIAILVRANNHAEPFVRAFARAGIPYQFLGPGQLFRQSEVKDLVAYLKVLYNFEDSVAMYRVLSMEWFDISPRDVAAVSNHAKKYDVSLFEACETLLKRQNNAIPRPFLSEKTEGQLKQLVEMIHRHLGLIKKETAGQILYYFLKDTGLLQQFALYKSVKEERIAGNIAKFFDKLKTYEVDHEDASVFAVIDWIDLSMVIGESPLATDTDWIQNDAVNILTVHSAKGLEFSAVFLVNLVSARFPTSERREQIPIPDALVKEILPVGDYHEQEERRLFYVGMTRARDLLYFTGAKYYGEGKREKKLSPFVEEAMGESAMDRYTQRQAKREKQLTLSEWMKKSENSAETRLRQPISYLSYSQIETFTTCPLQYKYRYIIRIPVPAKASLVFGDTIHRTMKAFYEMVKTGKHPTEHMLLNIYDNCWSSVGFGEKRYEEKMKKQGERILREYYKKGYDRKKIPLDVEQPFRIKISPSLTLGGKIDRVDRLSDGKLEIVDYKTGQAPKTRNVADDRQLTVYALAAGESGIYKIDPQNVIVSFYFFEGQQKISGTRTKEQLDEAKQDIAKTAVEISKSDFRPTPGKYCDFCEFRLICEAWQ